MLVESPESLFSSTMAAPAMPPSVTDYAPFHLAHMVNQHLALSKFLFRSPQLSRRAELADWLSRVAESLGLGRCTLHLAVKILDYFMDGHDIQEPQLFLVGLVSLGLAAKMEEADRRVPKVASLRPFIRDAFAPADFLQVEVMILAHTRWSLCFPTAVAFVEAIGPAALDGVDTADTADGADTVEFLGLLDYFADVAMKDIDLIPECPSFVAACIIYSTRVSFDPARCEGELWGERLWAYTGHSPEEKKFQQVVERMLDVYNGSAYGVKECCNDDDDGGGGGGGGGKDDEGFTTPTSRPSTSRPSPHKRKRARVILPTVSTPVNVSASDEGYDTTPSAKEAVVKKEEQDQPDKPLSEPLFA